MSLKRSSALALAAICGALLDHERNRLTSSDRLVFAALVTLADADWSLGSGDRSPVKTLALATGLGRVTVARCLRNLEQLGMIASERRKRDDGGTAANVYRVADLPEPSDAARIERERIAAQQPAVEHIPRRPGRQS